MKLYILYVHTLVVYILTLSETLNPSSDKSVIFMEIAKIFVKTYPENVEWNLTLPMTCESQK